MVDEEETVESPPPSRLDGALQQQQQQQQQQQSQSGDNKKIPPKRPSLNGRLSVRSMNFGIPTNQGARDHVEEHHGVHSWRYSVLKVLHSNKFQITLMALLLLDVLFIFTEIFLLATYPPCHTIERDGISCCPPPSSTAAASEPDHAGRFLAGDEGSHHDDFCESGLEPFEEYSVGCDPHKWERVHTAETVLYSLTIAILSTFFLELVISMIALKPQIFFRQFFFALDFVIVSVSLALEISFHALNDDAIQSVVGLLVAARLWRFVRIGHGIVEVTHELAHRQFNDVLAYAEELEALLQQHGVALPASSKLLLKYKESDEGNLLTEIEREHRAHHRSKHSSQSEAE